MITYKVRVYPNKTQRKLFDKMLLEAKELYNYYLECWNEYYKKTGKGLSKYRLEPYRKSYTFECLPAQVQQTVAGRLDDAFNRFFNKLSRHPKFKSIRQVRSITYSAYKHGFSFKGNHLKLTALGKIRAVFDRQIIGNPKQCTLKKLPSGKYYAFIAVDNSEIYSSFTPDSERSGKIVGIDPGLSKFLTLSDGNFIRRPVFLSKRMNQRLNRAQRKLSRKKSGSKNREKSRIKLAKIYEKITNQKRDHHFKVARWLVTNYEKIFIEKLESSFMIEKRKRISKSVAKLALDVAIFRFLVILHYMSNKYQSTIIDGCRSTHDEPIML